MKTTLLIQYLADFDQEYLNTAADRRRTWREVWRMAAGLAAVWAMMVIIGLLS